MKKMFVIVCVALLIGYTGVYGEAAEKNWNLVETEYTVQNGDTLESIAKEYIKKNTYGPRELEEFKSGIKELNEWLLDRDIKTGDILHINYWIKA